MVRVLYVVVILLIMMALNGCAPQATPQAQENAQTQIAQPQVAPVPTVGCSVAAPPQPPSRVNVNGTTRTFITAVPNSYQPGQPHALVVAFHGRTNSNEQARRYFGLEDAIPNALFVYPSGLRQGGSYTWSDPGDSAESLRDYAFFDEILRELSATYCLDEQRVFVVGHSLGASFANSLACARQSVRAVASLAGGISETACTPTAALVLHNPADRLVPVAVGEKVRNTFVAQNGAATKGVPITTGILASFRCTWFVEARNPVVWCPHDFSERYDGSYYPHTWPSTTGQAMAYFFETLP